MVALAVAMHLAALPWWRRSGAQAIRRLRGLGRRDRALAAAALVGSPLAVYLAATGYVEPVEALFGLGALYAAERVRRGGDGGAGGFAAWALAAGLLAGSAAGVKYIGLFFVGAAALLILRRAPARALARDLGLFALAAAAALAPTYGRLLAHTGDPLFPLFPALFGDNPWVSAAFLEASGTARREALTLLWDAAFRRAAVGGLPPLSPVFVLGLPLVVLGARRLPRLRPLLLLAVLELALAPTNAHYFLAVAPLWAVLLGAGAADLARRRPWGGRALAAAALAVALGGVGYAAFYVGRLGPPPATPAARERLLAAELPLYPAVAFLDRTAPGATAYAVLGERMVAYYGGTLLGDHNGPASYARVGERARFLGGPAAAVGEAGAAYLLVPEGTPYWSAAAAADPRLRRVYGDAAAVVYRVVPR